MTQIASDQGGSALEANRSSRAHAMKSATFQAFQTLIYDSCGIHLSDDKAGLVLARIGKRIRTLGIQTPEQYLARLKSEDGETELVRLIDAISTNVTSFFRESFHFEFLPSAMADWYAQGQRRFRIWSAASSTGEEPYTLAMTACEAFDTLTPPVAIIASDIDTNVLATAEKGVYPMERVEKLSTDRLRRFFLKGSGAQAGYVRVRPELQKLLSFTRINLLDARLPLQGPFDVMFCRNVMIYFDKPTQYAILKKFAPLLREDGLLFAGHSESFLHAADVFRSLGRTVYERADRPAHAPALKL